MGKDLSINLVLYLLKKGAAAPFYICPKEHQLTKQPNRFTAPLL